MNTKPLPLELRALSKTFAGTNGPTLVFEDVSLQVAAGETLALTGESGSGKSTLLHCAAGLEVADRGTVTVAGQDLSALDERGRAAVRREQLAVVFQQFNLIPSLTVAANIAFQARLAGRHDADWCAHLTTTLGLDDHLQKYPEEISGGQQQRVAIARALAPRPALVLADEPTGNLDEATGDDVIGLLLDLARDTGAGLLVVTHSPRVAARTDRRLHLSRGRLE